MDNQGSGNLKSHILLVSGPGTGKTHWIKRRIEYLFDLGVDPREILCITFTLRASLELKERIGSLAQEGIFIGTIHSFGLRLLLKNLRGPQAILDRESQISILKNIIGDENLAKKAQRRIELMKNTMRFGEDPVLRAYQEALRSTNSLDFEDLILKPLLEIEDLEIGKIRYIIVDEFQDLNRAQYELLRSIARRCGSFISACGDPDQSIYRFRGSDPSIFLNFESDHPLCTRLSLNENHRSYEPIVVSSQGLISHNRERFPIELRAKRLGGPKVKIVEVYKPWIASEFIVSKIEERLGGFDHLGASRKKAEDEFSFSDFAILVRTNREAKEIKNYLEGFGVPCKVIGESFEDDSLQRIKAHVESVLSSHGEEVKGVEVKEFFKLYPMDSPPSLLKLILRFFEGKKISDIYFELPLLSPMDDYDVKHDSLTLTTIHRSKGLEFKVVFILYLNEGFIPLRNGDIEEERRLLYVGMTRAKDELFLIKSNSLPPSSFLKEIPSSTVEYVRIDSKRRFGKQRLF